MGGGCGRQGLNPLMNLAHDLHQSLRTSRTLKQSRYIAMQSMRRKQVKAEVNKQLETLGVVLSHLGLITVAHNPRRSHAAWVNVQKKEKVEMTCMRYRSPIIRLQYTHTKVNAVRETLAKPLTSTVTAYSLNTTGTRKP